MAQCMGRGRGRGFVGKDKFSNLLGAAYIGNVKRAAECIKKGEDINLTDEEGMTPIHRAAQNGGAATVEFLLQKGANPRVASVDGETPLHVAAFYRNQDAVCKILKSDGAQDINTPTREHRMTPLHLAVYRGCPEIAEQLILAGADPSLEDAYGQTVHEMATFFSQQEQKGLTSPTARHDEVRALLKRLDDPGSKENVKVDAEKQQGTRQSVERQS